MTCQPWSNQLDAYLDAELPAEEAQAFNAHLRGCPSCAGDAALRIQMKSLVHTAGTRYVPKSDFRRKIQKQIAAPTTMRSWSWMPIAALATVVVIAGISVYVAQRRNANHIYSELADIHVTTLASSSPVDVVSSDRHTVKPWFQGKIPFSFDLPELQNSEFSLIGGRVTYIAQTPGAQLIYRIRKHDISVFIFQEAALPGAADIFWRPRKELSFNMESWSRAGLRYCLVGDASAADISALADLLKRAAGA